ncbi:MAG: aldo/keto reductase [Thermosphaera sp.]
MGITVLDLHGVKASRLGLGTWQFSSRLWGQSLSVAQAARILEAARSNGINLIDTAEIYGNGSSERLVGEAIHKLEAREEFVVITKIAGFRKPCFEEFLKAFRNSHKRLGFRPDIILHHWPPRDREQVCRATQALEGLVNQGYVYAYGFSNYGLKELDKALECVKKTDPIADQVQYSLAYRVVENGLKDFLLKHNMTLMAWSPLAKGALAGVARAKTLAQKTDKVFKAASTDVDLQNALEGLALKYGVTKATMALSWLIHQGAVPVVGTSNPSRVIEYSKALSLSLSEEDLIPLNNVSQKYIGYWGLEYRQPTPLVSIPRLFQKILVSVMRGI